MAREGEEEEGLRRSGRSRKRAVMFSINTGHQRRQRAAAARRPERQQQHQQQQMEQGETGMAEDNAGTAAAVDEQQEQWKAHNYRHHS